MALVLSKILANGTSRIQVVNILQSGWEYVTKHQTLPPKKQYLLSASLGCFPVKVTSLGSTITSHIFTPWNFSQKHLPTEALGIPKNKLVLESVFQLAIFLRPLVSFSTYSHFCQLLKSREVSMISTTGCKLKPPTTARRFWSLVLVKFPHYSVSRPQKICIVFVF